MRASLAARASSVRWIGAHVHPCREQKRRSLTVDTCEFQLKCRGALNVPEMLRVSAAPAPPRVTVSRMSHHSDRTALCLDPGGIELGERLCLQRVPSGRFWAGGFRTPVTWGSLQLRQHALCSGRDGEVPELSRGQWCGAQYRF